MIDIGIESVDVNFVGCLTWCVFWRPARFSEITGIYRPWTASVQALSKFSESHGVAGPHCSLACYRIALALYNISPFHPLAKFPGPKIAAASYVYEAYYD